MDKTKAKLEPLYKELCQALGELEFQKSKISQSLKELQVKIDFAHTRLIGMENMYKTFEEFEKELTEV